MLDNRHSQNVRRNRWMILAVIIVTSLLLTACGADKPKVYRVAILGVASFPDATSGFKARMTELGYIEGENIVYDEHPYDPATAEEILKKLVADKVDLIFAYSTASALSAKEATQGTEIPVVFALATLEGSGLVISQREPGANVTGARFPAPEITAKRFELLHQMLPQLKNLYITYDPTYPTAKSVLEALRPAAASAGVTLIEDQISAAEEIEVNLAAREASGDFDVDAILILPETLSQSAVGFGAINKFAAEHNLPVVGNIRSQLDQGALFFYAPAVVDGGREAAASADKVLKGAPAGTIPVVTPESRLVINYKAAEQLGIVIPDEILRQAFEIIR